MMKPFGFSPRAAADLDAIADYIAEDNPRRAKSFIEELLAVCAEIPAMPRAFSARPDLGKEVRVALHGRYMIFFRDLPDEIRIERVLHGARDLVRIFKE
jgi:toxin ParE1/3/4